MTEREVRLRDVTEGDLPVFFEDQRDPEANRMAAFPPRDREAFMVHWMKILRDPSCTVKTILFGDEVAGNIGSWNLHGEPQIGYWIGKNYWGRGIATRALAQFLTLVRARPLFARVAKHNVGSIRVLEKCGFEVVGEDVVPARPGADEIQEFIMRLGTLRGG
jgi:RimJ/RimL family protein N-acetyltransferase